MMQLDTIMALTKRGPGQPCEGETFVRLFNRHHYGPDKDLKKRAVATCFYLIESGQLIYQHKRHPVVLGAGDILVAFPEIETHATAPHYTSVLYFNMLGPRMGARLALAGITPESPTVSCPELLPQLERYYAIARGGSYRPYWPIRIAWNILDQLTHKAALQHRPVSTDIADMCRDIIDTEFMTDLSVQQIASELDVDRSTLLRHFTKRYGQSPQAYLLATRLDHAKQHLRNPHTSIKAAALACGFSDPDYFGRLFKKHFALPPGQWRKR